MSFAVGARGSAGHTKITSICERSTGKSGTEKASLLKKEEAKKEPRDAFLSSLECEKAICSSTHINRREASFRSSK